jgi:hypothetical protein
MSGHRHATDRHDATAIVQCSADADHLSYSAEVSGTDFDPDELVVIEECGVCGADVDSIVSWEQTEVFS